MTTILKKLDVAQRVLYHQVHPLKLATDISTAVASLVLLAEHHLGSALAVMFVPSIIASAILVQFGDFSTTRESRVGAYLRRYMTTTKQGVRFLGMGTAAVGAWLYVWWLLPVGARHPLGVVWWLGPRPQSPGAMTSTASPAWEASGRAARLVAADTAPGTP
jgi:hypothetical protein